ncbi:MAG: IS4 family transposase, partial [Thermodesulfobacteriota bacterium]|nr:IS4 family transposase [Thermodesulfobacteriota bacterium]
MLQTIYPYDRKRTLRFDPSIQHAYEAMIEMPLDKAKGNRPLQMTFKDELKSLVFFHLEEHTSAQHLLQVLEED